MYERAFKLEIITPSKVVYRNEATSLGAPGVLGGFQILYDHAPFLSALEIGTIKVKDATGNDTLFATSGGFIEVKDNHVVVLADTAERAEEIDVERAKSAKDRASSRLHSHDEHIDVLRAHVALLRAVNRLRIAERA
ncbi:MAG: F0F1 ATP synthase subunit epsilon [Ignavibacteriae bacterium]|nr:F0F1 ATP synthase subunit epsilon [Ignavibacteriota bacterium]